MRLRDRQFIREINPRSRSAVFGKVRKEAKKTKYKDVYGAIVSLHNSGVPEKHT